MSIILSTFTNSYAAVGGKGLVFCNAGTACVTHSNFNNNYIQNTGNGAAICDAESGNLEIESTNFTMDTTASLALRGTLIIMLDSLYASRDDICVQLVEQEFAQSQNIRTRQQGQNTPGLHTQDLSLAFTYKGEEVAYTGTVNAEALQQGVITFGDFSAAVPEPTSTTLSLLALAAFATRRSRK